MEGLAMIQSGQISAHTLKKTMIEKYGVNFDSDPILAADFNNILNVFSLLSSHLIQDSPESSRRNNPRRSVINSGKDKSIRIAHTPDLITNDGLWKKYGSKVIRKSPYQRGYYRCRYEDCKAKRHVQQIQKDQNGPLLFETTYFNQHTCEAATNDTHGSTRMIQFDNQVPSVTDWDLPPLLSDDHEEPIVHDSLPIPVPAPAPARDDDVHVSWFNPTIPVPAPAPAPARDDDVHVSWLNPTIPVPAPAPAPARNDDVHVSWFNPTIPVPAPAPAPARDDDVHVSWLNPTIPVPAPAPARDDDVHESWLNPTIPVPAPSAPAPPASAPAPFAVPVPAPARDYDLHVSWLNPTIHVNATKAEDESWLNPSIPVNEIKAEDDECLLKFDEPLWSPSYPDMDTFFEDDFDFTF